MKGDPRGNHKRQGKIRIDIRHSNLTLRGAALVLLREQSMTVDELDQMLFLRWKPHTRTDLMKELLDLRRSGLIKDKISGHSVRLHAVERDKDAKQRKAS